MNPTPPRGTGPGYLPVVELARRTLHGFELTVPGVPELETGVRAVASWGRTPLEGPAVVVDLAAAELHAGTAAHIVALLDQHAVRADALIVRVPTFSLSTPAPILEALVERGVAVAVREVDLRGAELGLLAGAPIDLIELPASLVDAIDRAPMAIHGVARLIALAHEHDWLTLAPGVARAGQLDVLDRLACDLASGPAIGAELPRVHADRVVARYFPAVAAGTPTPPARSLAKL